MKHSAKKHLYLPLGWFLLINLCIFLQASFSFSVLGLDDWLESHGLTMKWLSLIIALMGILGALSMLLASRPIIRLFLNAKMAENISDTKVQQLKLIVERQAQQAGIQPPTLAVYPSDEINAFAIGSGDRHSMLVVSQHLLDSLSLDELSAVVGHELTHINNGDMVTLSLIQGVINMCVHFPAYILGVGLDRYLFPDQHNAPVTRAVTLILHLIFAGLASLVVMGFSRHREFSADAGGAQLAGHAEMLAALRSLQAGMIHDPSMYPFAVLGLNGDALSSGLWRIFSSHPSIQERIQALGRCR